MNIDTLLGKTHEHLVQLEGTRFQLHKLALTDFLRLQKDALEDGFDLQIASAFRDYERQLHIWNLKARGERPLYDTNEQLLDFSSLSPKETVFAILRWSALPGCSRHHWGTDLDVYNGNTQTRESVQLSPSECEGQGPAAELHEWLSKKISQHEAYGFYRPYKSERGGISPEPWHVSHYPSARRMIDNFTFSLFKKNIEDSDILLKKEVLENAEDIYYRFIMNFDLP
jgi:LAS superfamily LD-carboxypeptidase LdcB